LFFTLFIALTTDVSNTAITLSKGNLSSMHTASFSKSCRCSFYPNTL